MVSKASELLPEPESPVMTTSRSRGIVTSMFLRLCSRAPRTMIASSGTLFSELRGEFGQKSILGYAGKWNNGAKQRTEDREQRSEEKTGRLREPEAAVVPKRYPKIAPS